MANANNDHCAANGWLAALWYATLLVGSKGSIAFTIGRLRDVEMLACECKLWFGLEAACDPKRIKGCSAWPIRVKIDAMGGMMFRFAGVIERQEIG